MTNKEIATSFLQMIVEGKIDEAYIQFIESGNFKHHNIYFKEDAESLKNGMKENHIQFPNKKITFHSVLEDGTKTIVHSHLELKENDPGIQVLHILDIQNRKIVEVWDIGQALPAESPNHLGAF